MGKDELTILSLMCDAKSRNVVPEKKFGTVNLVVSPIRFQRTKLATSWTKRSKVNIDKVYCVYLDSNVVSIGHERANHHKN